MRVRDTSAGIPASTLMRPMSQSSGAEEPRQGGVDSALKRQKKVLRIAPWGERLLLPT